MSSMGQHESYYDPPAPPECFIPAPGPVGLTPWFNMEVNPARGGWYDVRDSYGSLSRLWWTGIRWWNAPPSEGGNRVNLNPRCWHWRGMFAEDEIWRTQDGRRMRVGDMSGDHARNALRNLIKVRRQRMQKMQQDRTMWGRWDR